MAAGAVEAVPGADGELAAQMPEAAPSPWAYKKSKDDCGCLYHSLFALRID